MTHPTARTTLAAAALAAAAAAAAALPAHAIVIYNPAGAAPDNNTSPGAGSGWDRVGRAGTNGSGVHLGNGWILTAKHVNDPTGNPFVGADGTNYTYVPSTGQQLQDPTLSFNVDLYLYQVATPDGTPLASQGILPIAGATPTTGTNGTMIGTGRGQTTASPIPYFVDTDPDPWAWSTTDSADADLDADVLLWSGTRERRWATADVVATGVTEVFGSDLQVLVTAPDGSTTGGNAANNDSGSPLFLGTGASLELAGVVHAVGVINGQTGYSGQPLDGNSFAVVDPDGTPSSGASFYSDLSAYAPQINAVIPEPATATLLAAGLLGATRRRRSAREASSNASA